MTTNITAEHKAIFEALTSGDYRNFALFSCFVNGEPAAAIVAVNPDGDGYAIVLGKPDFSMCVGLHTHSANASEPCNETRTGLDHVSFGVAQRADLDTWAEHFKKHNVFQSPINDQGGYAVLVFRDPDNIQLELISMA